MMNGIKGASELSDRTPERKPAKRSARESGPSAPDQPQGADPASTPDSDLRLLIEKDAEGAYYVYKLVDRATGEVIAERPRDEVAGLAEGPEYRAGAVVNTKA